MVPSPPTLSDARDQDSCFRDGLGERRSTIDGSGQPRELLCIRSELTAVSAFPLALHQCTQRLGSFRHPYFAPAVSIEPVTAEDSTLGLLSEQVDGIRLSALFKRSAERGLNLAINAALCLIRQIVPAMARLHEADGCHGALGPERVVLTWSGRLMVTEYVFGEALEQLRYSQERYWRELRVAVPHSAGLPRFDHRTDVTQIGLIALSLVLGRALRDDEYPARVADVVMAAKAIAPRGGFEPRPPSLRGWLMCAVQLDVRQAFGSAAEAHDELERVIGDLEYPGLPASVDAFLMRYREAHPSSQPELPVVEIDRSREALPQPAESALLVAIPDEKPRRVIEWPLESDALLSDFSPETDLPPRTVSSHDLPASDRASVRDVSPAVRELFAVDTGGPSRRWPVSAGIGILATLVAAAVPLWGYLSPRKAAALGTGTLVISTSPRGASISLDGRPLGVTPLTVTVLAGAHTLEVRAEGEPKTVPVVMTAGGRVEHYIELPTTTDSPEGGDPSATPEGGERLVVTALNPVATAPGPMARSVPVAPPPGWILIKSPTDLVIEDGGLTLGSSSGGRHVLTLRNDALSFQTTRTVQIAASTLTTATVDVPNGQLSLNAAPWAEVWIDGTRVGDTPIGNLAVPIGAHDVVMRHPELGERRTQVMVSATGASRLSVDLRDRPTSNDQ